jgi:hypothetical protein
LHVVDGAIFGLHTFLAITIVLMMFIFHDIAISRSRFVLVP